MPETPIVAQLVARDVARRWPQTPFTVQLCHSPGGSVVCVSWRDGPTERAVTALLDCYDVEQYDDEAAGYPETDVPMEAAVTGVVPEREITSGGFALIAAAIEHDYEVEVPRTADGIDWDRAERLRIRGPIQLTGSRFTPLEDLPAAAVQGPIPLTLALHLIAENVDLTTVPPEHPPP